MASQPSWAPPPGRPPASVAGGGRSPRPGRPPRGHRGRRGRQERAAGAASRTPCASVAFAAGRRGRRRGRPPPASSRPGPTPSSTGRPRRRQHRRPRQRPQGRPLHRRLLPGAPCPARPVRRGGCPGPRVVLPYVDRVTRRLPHQHRASVRAAAQCAGRAPSITRRLPGRYRPLTGAAARRLGRSASITFRLPVSYPALRPGRTGPARSAKSRPGQDRKSRPVPPGGGPKRCQIRGGSLDSHHTTSPVRWPTAARASLDVPAGLPRAQGGPPCRSSAGPTGSALAPARPRVSPRGPHGARALCFVGRSIPARWSRSTDSRIAPSPGAASSPSGSPGAASASARRRCRRSTRRDTTAPRPRSAPQLGEPAVATAWAAGRAMALGQAVAESLADAPQEAPASA